MVVVSEDKEEVMDNTHRIVLVNGHYEAYNSYGEFVTSGDTYKECEDDLIEMLMENARMENIREKVSAWTNTNTDIKDHINTKVNL